jgi:cytidylate kinase
MVVAIDGPAGTGKSSVSTRLAELTGFFYINSGRLYRAITWKALQQGKTSDSPQALIATAADISIEIKNDRFLVDGKNRNAELHTPEVDREVATVSSIPEIRIAVNTRIKRIAGTRDIIVEGRDMSTVVFPDAEVKIYLDADPAVRARRRAEQLGDEADYQEILASIRDRDEIDRLKAVGPLKQSPDAEYVDTTDLTLDQVCEKVIDIIHVKTKHGRS